MEEVALYPPLCSSQRTIPFSDGWATIWEMVIIDALDDLEKDIKNNAYNPFLLQYNYQGEDLDTFSSRLLPNAEFILIHTLGEIAKSFELLSFKRLKDISGNIIYLGMQKKTEHILGRGNYIEDPYEVLKSIKGAGKEEIQKAYQRLVKYHPDQYRSPLKKLAEEKMAR